MECIQGKSIFNGIAIGRIAVYEERKQEEKYFIEDTAQELLRYEKAREQVIHQLQELYVHAAETIGKKDAEVFLAHTMLLQDAAYNQAIKQGICEHQENAEYTVARVEKEFAQLFAGMEDEYLQARSEDIHDISGRLLRVLKNVNPEGLKTVEPQIIVAKRLTPSETIRMNKEQVLAFVTEEGSVYSHTAILARSMNIPALTGIEGKAEWNGRLGALDGFSGTFFIEPDEETLQRLQEKQRKLQKQQLDLAALKGRKTITKNGRRIQLFANIETDSDVDRVLENDAEGIGLFRTEFLYLEREKPPTEEEQFRAYQYVAERMGGKSVIIRTLDMGADKKADYMELEHEENPAMGYRAIRICLNEEQIFLTQLRAILRAAVCGNIAVMFPMIIALDEVKRAKELLEQAKRELAERGEAFGEIKVGIMIETPAAVMISEELAEEVDFFSIGTNDLTQYTLAIDRQNHKLDAFYDAHHPAVLKMLRMVVESAHKKGIPVGICGELGADLELMKDLIDMGVDELSVAPTMVLQVRHAILEL